MWETLVKIKHQLLRGSKWRASKSKMQENIIKSLLHCPTSTDPALLEDNMLHKRATAQDAVNHLGRDG